MGNRGFICFIIIITKGCITISIVYRKAFIERINKIHNGAFENIKNIESFPPEAGLRVLIETLETSAKSGNHANIDLAKEFILRIPEGWLIDHLPQAVEQCLFKEQDWEEWEFRRIAEMLKPYSDAAFMWFVQYAKQLNNEEVNEAIEDYAV